MYNDCGTAAEFLRRICGKPAGIRSGGIVRMLNRSLVVVKFCVIIMLNTLQVSEATEIHYISKMSTETPPKFILGTFSVRKAPNLNAHLQADQLWTGRRP
jgi:hypothetical protein